MSYMTPDANGSQRIYQNISGDLHQQVELTDIVYKSGDPRSVNEAIALTAALIDFLTSQGIDVRYERRLPFGQRKLTFGGITQLEHHNALFDSLG